MNEINLIDQVIDVAIGSGLFKSKQEVSQVIHAAGVIRHKLQKLENLESETMTQQKGPSLEDKPGPNKIKHKGNS